MLPYDQLIVAALLIGGGLVLGRWGGVGPTLAADLNKIVLGGPLPALVFLAMQAIPPQLLLLSLPALAWVAVLLTLGLGLVLARGLRLPGPEAGALALAMAFGNTTYIGYPLVTALAGDRGLAAAVYFDQLGATMAATTVGAVLAFRLGGAQGGAGAAVRRLLTFPPLWAVAVGAACHGLVLHPWLEGALRQLGALAVPLMLLSLGLMLCPTGLADRWKLVALGAAYKLVAFPLLVIGLARAGGVPAGYAQVAVLEASMPVMFYALALAQAGGLAAPLVADLIMVSTAASLVTVPIWIWWLGPI
jgi:predicted permease